MRNLLKLTVFLSLLFISTNQIFGQIAVRKAIKSAEIVNNDASKSNVKILKKDYKKALKEINKLKSSALKKVEMNEEIAIQGGDWISLQNTMERLAQIGVLNFKVEDLDYETPWIAAKQKTCDLYFEKGKTELEKSSKIDNHLTAFDLFNKASEFGTAHNDEINQLKKEIILPKVLELSKSWKNSDKERALKILNNIEKNYSNNPEVMAKIEIEHRTLREEFYKEAEKLFEDRNYKDQYKAISAYELVGNYQDAPLKAEMARKRGALTVAIMEEYGDTSITLHPNTIKKLQKEFPDYFIFTGYEGLTKRQLIENKCALLFVYNGKKFGQSKCTYKDDKKKEEIIEYVEKTIKKGKLIEKKISKREYEKGKDLMGRETANFVVYKGLLETNWTTSTITMDYSFKVIDLREDTIKAVATIEKPGELSLSVTSKYIETYRGDDYCSPKKLKNINDHIDEKGLIKKAKKAKIYGWDFNLLLTNKADEIKKELEDLLPYQHYAE